MSEENERSAQKQMRILSQEFFSQGWRVKSMDVFDCGFQIGFVIHRDEGMNLFTVGQHVELCGWQMMPSHANENVIVVRVKTNGAVVKEVER